MKTINCSVCGVVVHAPKRVSVLKYCKKCAADVGRDQARESQRRMRVAARRGTKWNSISPNMYEIIRLNSEALKLETSYGRYVAGLYNRKYGGQNEVV